MNSLMKVFRSLTGNKPILDTVGISIKRKAIHVDEVGCNNCGLIFQDKYMDEEYSNHDAGRKMSYGEHKVQCPYCDHINARPTAAWDQVKERGQFRDYTGDMRYGTRFGPKPPLPKHLEKTQVTRIAEKETSFFHKLVKKF